LNKIYTADVADTIINACGTSVMFAVADPKTARYLSDKIGETEFLETEETYSMGVADNRDGVSLMRRRKIEKLILPSEFQNLRDLRAYVKIPNIAAVTITDFRYKSYPTTTEPFVIREDLLLDNVVARQTSVMDDAVFWRQEAKKELKDKGIDLDNRAEDREAEIEEELHF
jgi:type IV secretory pathway TraG/TraD family ATPase VirD4